MPEGRPPRRYCGPEHHAAHRARRHVAPAPVEPTPAEPILAEPILAEPILAEPILAEPVVVEPIAAHVVVSAPVVGARPSRDAERAEPAAVGAVTSGAESERSAPDTGPAASVTAAALLTDAAALQPRPGSGPLSSSGSHAEAAQRAAADDAPVHIGTALVVDALTGLPSTREPRRRRHIDVSPEDHDAFQRWKASRAARTRRTRRLAGIVGAAGILAAGGTFVVKDLPDWFDPDHVPRIVARADWQSQARIALTSIDTQLGSIAATKALWDSEIAPHYDGRVPTEVAALLARKTLLEQQRAALQGQLATAEQLAHARAVLEGVDRQLSEIDATLGSLPRGALNPDQQFVRDSLTSRRGLLVEERAARHSDVTRLQDGVAVAESSPVPDPTDQTEPLTRRVLDLRDRPAVPPLQPQAPPPVATAPDRRDTTVLADGGDAVREPTRGVRAAAAVRPPAEVTETDAGSARRASDDSAGGGSTPDPTDSSSSGGSRDDSADTDSSGSSGSGGSGPSGSGGGSTGGGSSDDGGSGGSGGSGDGSGGSGMTPQQAYDAAMNTPGGRMHQFIRGASGG
ncbi:hypothetical protein [Pseudonocardia sp. N23]|uniref:hypothetical protein n=1 Tax=Pseudonocardia sp. N23 TaxID=1987376 RepID=UPI000BFC4F72|nr:hypothetical protein [Pseudonocardia sp. N23]GAY13174.1 endoglucanase [Pseudonocardia sp. N23]